MKFSISTHWNAGRHANGETLIEEIVELGFDQVELGYNLRSNLVPGIKRMVHKNVVTVRSVHNFCPVPAMATRGHPELYTLASNDKREREAAVHYTAQTIRFAKEIGAEFVVIHCGNVDMSNITHKLITMLTNGKRYTNGYEKLKLQLIRKREKRVSMQLRFLIDGLKRLEPILSENRIRLGLENLPSWEAIPTENECHNLLRKLGTEHYCYWHDIGHAQIRENLGFANHVGTLSRLQSVLGGMHIHDVACGVQDHVMPPAGDIDFRSIKKYTMNNIVRVLEPHPKMSGNEIKLGLEYLSRSWSQSE